MSDKRAKAKELMVRYLKLGSGIAQPGQWFWNSDNTTEAIDLVDYLIDAGKEEAQEEGRSVRRGLATMLAKTHGCPMSEMDWAPDDCLGHHTCDAHEGMEVQRTRCWSAFLLGQSVWDTPSTAPNQPRRE